MSPPRKRPPAKKAAAAKKAAPRPRAAAVQRSRRTSLTQAGSNERSMNVIINERARGKKSKEIERFTSALVAAAEASLPATASTSPEKIAAATQAWHRAVYAYARTVPELGAAKLYVGNCLSQVKLKVVKRNADGSIDPQFFDQPSPEEPKEGEPPEEDPVPPELRKFVDDANEIVSTLRSPYGGQSELMRSYGEKMFLAGDLWLLPVDHVAGLSFEALSTIELVPEGKGYKRILGPAGLEQTIPEDTVPLRVYCRDPEFSSLSTSSVQACIEILEELVILTRLVRSAAIQRLALSGILAIADDFDDPIDDDGEDGQSEENMNPLASDIIESGAVAIDDPASAAAWLPYILQGPLKAIQEGIRLIRFEGDDALNVVKRREALERFAQGVDLPVEAVLGHQQTTYANAAQISEDRFKVHIEPLLQRFCDAATVGVMWPSLAVKVGLPADRVKEAGYPPEILSFAVGYDASALVALPDRTKDLIEVLKVDKSMTVLWIREIRAALGLDPDDLPDDDEIARRVNFARLANSRETIDATDVSPEQQEAQMEANDNAGITAAMAVALGVAERIAGAMELTIERAASRIGAKLRSKASVAQKETINGRPNVDVARVLGPSMCQRLLKGDNPAESDLAELRTQVARWAGEIGVEAPRELADEVCKLTAEGITSRLYDTEMKITRHSLLELVASGAAKKEPADV